MALVHQHQIPPTTAASAAAHTHLHLMDSSDLPEPDVLILTSGRSRIPAHSSILAAVSPVLENVIDRPTKRRSSERIIPILGVPCDAVSAFIRFLYSSRCTDEESEKFGIHLLALSHVYLVPHLKQRCAKSLGQRLTIENVVDVLQLARLCDSPDLYLKCMKLVYSKFKAVENTEGWKFMQGHDPWLELQVLQFIDEAESRRKRTRRLTEEKRLYMELSEAMDCLEHICTEGCTSVGPYDVEPTKNKGPCSKFSTCQGIQLLIKHFASCSKRVNGGCSRCKRMWQLLRLHASICEQSNFCRVPLCSHLSTSWLAFETRGRRNRWRNCGIRAEVNYVNADDAKTLVETDGYVILDVRDKSQYNRAHIKSSYHVPLFIENQANDLGTIILRTVHNNFSGLFFGIPFTKPNPEFLESVRSQFSPDSKLLVVCQEGLRSTAAANKLDEVGFENVACITSGLQSVKPGTFDSEGPSTLQDAGKAGLVQVQGKISAVLGTVLICAYLFITLFPDQAEKLFQLIPAS